MKRLPEFFVGRRNGIGFLIGSFVRRITVENLDSSQRNPIDTNPLGALSANADKEIRHNGMLGTPNRPNRQRLPPTVKKDAGRRARRPFANWSWKREA